MIDDFVHSQFWTGELLHFTGDVGVNQDAFELAILQRCYNRFKVGVCCVNKKMNY